MLLRHILLFLICIVFCSGIVASERQQPQKPELVIYSEVWPPFQYFEGDAFVGTAANLVTQTLDDANWPFVIHVVPWARAISSVKANENSLIFSISRTPQRENEFIWLHQLGHVKTKLLSASHRDDIVIESLADVKKYRLILKRNEASTDYFINLGFHPVEDIIYVNNSQQALALLQIGRADIYPITDAGFEPSVQKTEFETSQFKYIFDLDDFDLDLYIAANKNIDPKISAQLQQLFVNHP